MFPIGETGHKSYECRANRRGHTQQAAAMQILEPSIPTIQQTRHDVCNENHNWTEHSRPKEGEVQLVCGCMIPIVAGALSPDGQSKLVRWSNNDTPNCVGRVNDVQVSALRDTGSTTCVIKSSLVRPEQYTGFYDRCVLIDGVVKCFPTAIINVDTPFFKGVTKALCMDNPVQELIIGNVPGALGVESCPSENECFEQDTEETETKQVNNEVDETKTNDDKEQNETQPSSGIGGAEIPANKDNQHIEITNELKDSNDCEQAAAVQTRAMKERESKPAKPVKPLKVTVISGLDIGPKQLIEQQKSDETLKRYWE